MCDQLLIDSLIDYFGDASDITLPTLKKDHLATERWYLLIF